MIEVSDHIIYSDGKCVGSTGSWCCGIDVRLNHRPKALFSVLKVRNGYKLQRVVKALMSIKIPKRGGHWNFHYETAKDTNKLAKYEALINKTP